MGLFDHDDEAKDAAHAAEEAAHPEPVTIDLGQQQSLDVQLVVNQLLEEGLTLYLLDAGDLGETTPLYPAQCKVLVKAEDAERAREAFVEAGFLEG